MAQYQVGRLFDHVHLRAKNLEASKRFYKALMTALDHPPGHDGGWFYQVDELFISGSHAEEGIPPTHVHIAFQARDRDMVKAVYEAGLNAGGRDNGGPGERDYHPGYYAAFLLDPDGNNVEAVHHGPNTRSAPSVVIEG